MLQNDKLVDKVGRQLLLLHGATLLEHYCEQQGPLGTDFDASKTESTVKTATSQVTLAFNTESANEAAAAPKAVAVEAPDVTFSSEKAGAAVMGHAEKAAAVPKAAGLEAPDETADSQEADVIMSQDDEDAAAASEASKSEAPDATVSSWEVSVTRKEDADGAAAVKASDQGQAAQKERQRVYLQQAIIRSVSPRPLAVS